jgi:hypothetical protein
MSLVICPGCTESFEADERIGIADFRELGLDLVTPIETEHHRDDRGRLFCCRDCFIANS